MVSLESSYHEDQELHGNYPSESICSKVIDKKKDEHITMKVYKMQQSS